MKKSKVTEPNLETVAWSTRMMPRALLNRLRMCAGMMPLAGWADRTDVAKMHKLVMEAGLDVIEKRIEADCGKMRRQT